MEWLTKRFQTKIIQNGSNTNVYPNTQKNNSSKIFVKKDGDIFSIYFGKDEELYNFNCNEKSYNSQNNNKNYSNNLERKVYKRVLFNNFIENFKKYYLQKIDKELKNNIIKELTLKQDNSRKKHQEKNLKINSKLLSLHKNKKHQIEFNRFKEEQIKIQKNINNLKNNKNISNELKSIIKEKYKNVNVNLNVLSEEIARFFIENNIVIPMYYYKTGNKTTYFVNPNILIIRDGSNQDVNVRQDNFYLFCKNGERITLNRINNEDDDNIRQLSSFFYENLSETLKEYLCSSLTKKIKSFFNLERKPTLLKYFDNKLLDYFINKIKNKHTNQPQNKGPRQPNNNFSSFEFKNKGAMNRLKELQNTTKKLREKSEEEIKEIKKKYHYV